ncbi:GGDEF domain-containing protein [Gilvimarinus sp. 1_MG-2023]|uniref:GGDEF domain-containing protein n=1 Tax=Gilvimarinus sp. 1_MG-2023 TaxID=3062638 RepID=UPI0026E2AD8C|nr:GGDEF domain-containing protein [Gilvimarinus sp. 1_MG-2023]MDO6745759.1 GGDEF domain-containing protein [Gilvimarinus sp. 1_MG-2023]
MTDKADRNEDCVVCGPSCPYRDEVLCLRKKIDDLQTIARTDALTGLFNYRHFCETLTNEMERVRRSGQPMALVIGDVDHFKHFNDTHGHELGNEVLKGVGRCIDRTLRKLDVACRYGGEEFALILPGTNLRQAQRVAERVRKSVAAEQISAEDGSVLTVTMSLGCTLFSTDCSVTPDQLVAAADKQLYQAKNQGRNCVCVEERKVASSSPVTQEEKSALFELLNNSANQDD